MPPLDLYARKSRADYEWWVKRLSKETREDIRYLCHPRRRGLLDAVAVEVEKRIDQLIGLGLRDREKNLQKIVLPTRLGVMLLACHRVRTAWLLFASLAEHDASSPQMTGFPREMTLRGGHVVRDLVKSYPTYWPFEDEEEPLDEGS
jgi:hypothetical protein